MQRTYPSPLPPFNTYNLRRPSPDARPRNRHLRLPIKHAEPRQHAPQAHDAAVAEDGPENRPDRPGEMGRGVGPVEDGAELHHVAELEDGGVGGDGFGFGGDF